MAPRVRSDAIAMPAGLPRELDDDAPWRLQVGALVCGAALLLGVLSEPWRPASADAGPVASVAGAMGVAFAITVAAAARRVPRERLISLGLGLLVGLGVVIWVVELSAPFGATTHTPGVPLAAAWLLVFPMLVSLPTPMAVSGAAVVTLAGPLVLMAYVQRGQPAPSVAHAALWFLGAASAGALSIGTTTLLGRAAAQVRAARDAAQYELGEVLGQGGMGEVRVAWHRRLACPVAIKRIRPDLVGAAEGWSFAERFVVEAQVTARLTSPHTVALHDFGETERGDLYYVMELIDGVDLHDVVRWGGPLAPARVVRLLLHAVDALAEAHEAGLVHRDIKPSNLMICPRGPDGELLKVLDFGTVKVGEVGEGDLAVGTPAFAAPEAQRGAAVPASDIYGLGCVAWWLLAGDTVHPDDTPEGQRRAHAAGVIPDLGAAAPWPIPDAMVQVVLRCLATDPDARPSAAELRDLLAAIPTQGWSAADARAWWREARR